jgi:putative MATE family efflux protein
VSEPILPAPRDDEAAARRAEAMHRKGGAEPGAESAAAPALSALSELSAGEESSGTPAWAAPSGDLTTGPVNRALFRLAGPAILARALHTLLALVDVFWVGRLGAAATAAVTTSYFASWILLSATDLTAIGILAHVARHVGAGDRQRAGQATAQGLRLGLGLGIVLAIAAWFGAPALFAALGAEGEVARRGIVYLRLLFLAAPFTFTYINSEFAMRAAGDTRTPLLVTGGMVLFNAVLAPLLIYGVGPLPRLEVMGAGLATLLAQVVAVVAFAALARARHANFPLDRAALRRNDRALLGSLLRIGFPGMAIGVLFSTIYLFISGIAARLGTSELAVVGLGNRAESATYLVVTGFAAATATLVGQNLGARRPDRAARAAWASGLWMLLYGLGTGGVMILWPRAVLGLFTSDATVIDMGAAYVRVLGFAQPLMAMEIVFEHAFSGAGDTLPPMLISVPMNALRVPLLWWVVGVHHAGLLGIGWILAITCMVRGLVATLWFRRGTWRHRRL